MYERILVPVDGSPTSTRGLDEAIRLARLTHAHLRLVHVVDELPIALSADAFAANAAELIEVLRQGGETVLREARAKVEAAGVPVDTVLTDTFRGRVCDQVVDQAKAWPAQLIVLGTHGRRGAGRVLMGSDAEQILRHAPVPVLLVRADGPAAP